MLLSLGLVLGLAGCDEPLPDAEYDGLDACSDPAHGTEAYFQDTMVPELFQPYCEYCHWSSRSGADRHGAPEYLDFDDFASATSVNGLTWELVAARTMPPMARTPSTEELEMLLDWLNCTTPPERDLPTALDADCSDPSLGYADVEATLAESCNACHDSALGSGERSGAPISANYDTAAGVRAVGELTVWNRILDDTMPPTFQEDRVSVSEADALVLHTWLSCEAPD